MGFKNWMLKTENLAGPGGGPSGSAENQEALAQNIASRGAGAFPTGGDNPPLPSKTPTEKYLDVKHRKKFMKVGQFQNRMQYTDEKPHDVSKKRWETMKKWQRKRDEEEKEKSKES